MKRLLIASRVCLRFGVLLTAILASISAVFAQTISSVSVAPNPVVGGFSAVGTVTISDKAPAAGFTVPLSVTNPSVTVPVWVLVPAGRTSATFKVTTTPVAVNTPVTLIARGGGEVATTVINVNVTSVASLTLNPTTVLAGDVSTGTVTLVGAAPSVGFEVSLDSDTLAAAVPTKVTVLPGQTSATFTITTLGVPATGFANISASGGATATADLKITAARVLSLTLQPNKVFGGLTSTGTVTLSADSPTFGTEVVLTSSLGSVTLPTSVMVLSGSRTATFTVNTKAVSDDVVATISGTSGGRTRSADLTVQAPFAEISVAPTSVIGGNEVIGSVTLSEPAPKGGITIALSSGSATAMVPATVTVAAGQTTATFKNKKSPVAADEVVTLSSTRGTSLRTTTLKVLAPTVASISVNPPVIVGGRKAIGTVVLNGAAPTGGITVPLTSNRPSAPVPSTIVVPAGKTSGTFDITTTAVSADVIATIRANVGLKPTTTLRITQGPALADSAWPKYRGNGGNTGQGNGPVAVGLLKWFYQANQAIYSSASIGPDGTIYVGGDDTSHSLEAINPNGTLKWSFATDSSVYSSPAITTDGSVYFGSFNKLYALKADGTLKWTFATGGVVLSSPAVGPDGTIFVGSYDGSLYAVKANGTLRWSLATLDRIVASPAVAPDGTVYITSTDGSLYVVSADGVLKWKRSTGGIITSSPAVDAEGTVYVRSNSGGIFAFKADGSTKWSYFTDSNIGSAPAVAADGSVYVGTGKTLLAITAKGAKKWQITTGGYVESAPSLAVDGTVYFGSADKKVYAVTATGSRLWSYLTGGAIHASPTVATDGTVYVGSLDAKFYAIK